MGEWVCSSSKWMGVASSPRLALRVTLGMGIRVWDDDDDFVSLSSVLVGGVGGCLVMDISP